MKRAIWLAFVPGTTFAIIANSWTFLLLIVAEFVSDSNEIALYIVTVAVGLIAILNITSWDYQRRQRAGGAP